MKEGFTEAQCNLLYQAEMWKAERIQILKEHAALTEGNKRLRIALHGISLAAQSSMGGGVYELGKMARAALEQKP